MWSSLVTLIPKLVELFMPRKRPNLEERDRRFREAAAEALRARKK